MHEKMLDIARNAMNMAYAPYSNFHVGCSILDNNFKIHFGCNVENASYPVGTCAESGAISAMISCGGTYIREIAIIGQSKTLVTPCGACRQKIREFSRHDTKIYICNLDSIQKEFSIDDLLPYSFGPDNLN